MEFTYDAYKNLLRLITEKYEVVDYHTYQGKDRVCILRHDIDMSPAKAVELAEVEHSCGVKSTYFVMLNTGFYNCAYGNTTKLIRRLGALGHEVGLHFDETQYADCDDENALKAHVYNEIHILERLYGGKVTTVSMHRPSKKTLESVRVFKRVVNSYSKVLFDDFKYMSDSRMRWREDVEGIVAAGQYNALHILTHPIWYTETGMTAHDILKNFVQNAKAERYSALCDNIRDLNEILEKDEI